MPAFSRFLRYFIAVGRHGSIRRAADELANKEDLWSWF